MVIEPLKQEKVQKKQQDTKTKSVKAAMPIKSMCQKRNPVLMCSGSQKSDVFLLHSRSQESNPALICNRSPKSNPVIRASNHMSAFSVYAILADVKWQRLFLPVRRHLLACVLQWEGISIIELIGPRYLK